MNKFLLSMATVAMGFGMASADEVTFDFVNNDYGMTRLSGGTQEYNPDPTLIKEGAVEIKLTSALGEESTNGAGSRLWSDGVRFYVGGTAEISAPGYVVTGLDVTLKSGQNLENFTINGETAVSPWTGSAENVVFAYTPGKSNNAVQTLTVTYQSADAPVLEPAGLAFEESTASVNLGDAFTGYTLINPNNLPVAWSSSEETVATVDQNGVVSILGAGTTVIAAESEATDVFSAGIASYTLTVVKAASAASIAELMEIVTADEKAEVAINFPMTVTYKNGASTYVTDGMGGFTLIYGSNDYTDLDIIPAGWVASYSPFNGLPEFKITGESPAATGKGVFTPRTVTLADVDEAMVNEVVIINNVAFAEATPAEKANFTGTDGEASVAFRNNFLIESVEAGTYDVLAVPAIYKSNIQVYPIEYSLSTGIGTIEADGVATYYDINGRIVKGNLQNGLYIKVQYGKATKVIVK